MSAQEFTERAALDLAARSLQPFRQILDFAEDFVGY
jgi:hypothetical protein